MKLRKQNANKAVKVKLGNGRTILIAPDPRPSRGRSGAVNHNFIKINKPTKELAQRVRAAL